MPCGQPHTDSLDNFLPGDVALPFFAYGLFRPGQIAFFRLQEFVERATAHSRVLGDLRVRDGLPLLVESQNGSVTGSLLEFRADDSTTAYGRIAELEPRHQYEWRTIDVDGRSTNVLFGRRPDRGAVPLNDDWDGWQDPLFVEALTVVEETIRGCGHGGGLPNFFRTQMAYMLLWSSIERYASLRHGLGSNVMAKLKAIAGERAFVSALETEVAETPTERRAVVRADDPTRILVLDRQRPTKALEFYYQVRSNMTHRGKGVVHDHDLVHKSLMELLAIFKKMLAAAETEAKQYKEELIRRQR